MAVPDNRLAELSLAVFNDTHDRGGWMTGRNWSGQPYRRGRLFSLAAACLLTPTETVAATGIECAEAALSTANSLRKQRGRVVVLGETHGTQEAPALVGDLACHLADDGRVLVGIEMPRWLDKDVAAFVARELDEIGLTTAERAIVLPDETPLAG